MEWETGIIAFCFLFKNIKRTLKLWSGRHHMTSSFCHGNTLHKRLFWIGTFRLSISSSRELLSFLEIRRSGPGGVNLPDFAFPRVTVKFLALWPG